MPARVRTVDLLIKSQLLYQLSYGHIRCAFPKGMAGYRQWSICVFNRVWRQICGNKYSGRTNHFSALVPQNDLQLCLEEQEGIQIQKQHQIVVVGIRCHLRLPSPPRAHSGALADPVFLSAPVLVNSVQIARKIAEMLRY